MADKTTTGTPADTKNADTKNEPGEQINIKVRARAHAFRFGHSLLRTS